MVRIDVWHHYLSFHIWDWIELLTQNLEIIGFWYFCKTNSATTPGVCLAGALFFQKNTYICFFLYFGKNHHKSLWRRSPAGSFVFKKNTSLFKKTRILRLFVNNMKKSINKNRIFGLWGKIGE